VQLLPALPGLAAATRAVIKPVVDPAESYTTLYDRTVQEPRELGISDELADILADDAELGLVVLPHKRSS